MEMRLKARRQQFRVDAEGVHAAHAPEETTTSSSLLSHSPSPANHLPSRSVRGRVKYFFAAASKEPVSCCRMPAPCASNAHPLSCATASGRRSGLRGASSSLLLLLFLPLSISTCHFHCQALPLPLRMQKKNSQRQTL